jgi:hypothetical protein
MIKTLTVTWVDGGGSNSNIVFLIKSEYSISIHQMMYIK